MFTPAALTFLRQLRRNNRREWFVARKATFEEILLAPMREFVEEIDVRLATLAPEIGGTPKRSIFRIHRDVRFSRDKSPYKTHMGCWFTARSAGHGVGSETHGAGAGFYFHLEPGACLVAGGIWMPPRDALKQIRQGLAERHREFERTIAAPAFRRRFGSMSEERVLTRVPRPWDASHPAARWLRFASFTASAPLDDAVAIGPKLVEKVVKDLAVLLPMVRWLNTTLGYPPRDRRDGW
ncbi:MAG: DUF2461 domain-containing protein [Gemmatimonadaceae bacterium]|nr:DUF2461 domain-containing protein [Gemmatimonadaceae bacterium]